MIKGKNKQKLSKKYKSLLKPTAIRYRKQPANENTGPVTVKKSAKIEPKEKLKSRNSVIKFSRVQILITVIKEKNKQKLSKKH